MAEIRPYDGDQPYIFISYAHANSPAVMEVVHELHHRGFRIWYDDGIEVGSEWQENIAQHLADASLMIAFVSNAYMRSDNCRKEMHYAVSKKKNLINIFLEETRLTPGMEMQIGNLFALMKYTMSDETFYAKLWNAPQLGPELLCADSPSAKSAKPQPRAKKQKKVPIDLTVEQQRQRKRKIRRHVRLSVLLGLLLAAVIFGIIAWSTGLAKRVEVRFQQEDLRLLPDDTVVDIKNELLEQAAREFCGIPEGEMKVSDLAGLTELYIYGDRYSLHSYEAVIGEENTGSIEDLSDLAFFTHLEKLVLAFQPLRSLETMPACPVEYLSIDYCPLTSLQGIGSLLMLREFNADACPIRDLGDLSNCLELRRLCLMGANVSDFSSLKPLIHLAEAELSNCGLNELDTLLGLSGLTDLTFRDCDLRGSFFKAFDRERIIVSLTLIDCKLNSTDNLDDFKGLTTLSLARTGETLDWSILSRLPALRTVYIDTSMKEAIGSALSGTDVQVIVSE